MFVGLVLAILVLLGPSTAQLRENICKCSAHRPAGLRVNCRALNLTELPLLPSSIVELHLQDNQLSTVRRGQLDALQSLRVVNLSGNPWHCDCTILYLSAWLQDQMHLGGNPKCSTPSRLVHKPIVELTELDLPDCASNRCGVSWLELLTLLLLGGLIALLVHLLYTTKNCSITFNVGLRHTGMGADRLRSLKPKHRRRRYETSRGEAGSTLEWTHSAERPLLDVELLPQLLDGLQKKNNIKFKET